MERVTCFKLCYVLGVAEEVLRKRYVVESRVAFEHREFHTTEAIECVRNSSEKFYFMMQSYGAGLLEILNDIIATRRKFLHQAYCELEVNLSEELFNTIVELPQLSNQTAVQLAFILKSHGYAPGSYFLGKDLFNVAPDLMFKDDTSLRDRLCLYTGTRLGPIFDMSSFGSAVRTYVGSVFVDNLGELGSPIYRHDGAVSNLNYQAWCANNCYPEAPTPLVPRSVVVTSDARWVAKTAQLNPDVNFVVVLPVYPKYYRAWRRRVQPNIRFLSTHD